MKVALAEPKVRNVRAATLETRESRDNAREHHEGNGHGDMVRLRREIFFEGSVASRGSRRCRTSHILHSQQWEHGMPRVRVAPSRNAMNPTIGSRMQQACESMAEKPGAVVQNHKVGTRCSRRDPRARSEGGDTGAGVDATEDVDGGEDTRRFALTSRQRCRGGRELLTNPTRGGR